MLALSSFAACRASGGQGYVVDDETVWAWQARMAREGVVFRQLCASDVDCGGLKDSCCTGGKCSKDGWCSPKCKSDQDCPEGYFCIDHDGTRCFAACIDDRDCPTGWICEQKSDHFTCRFK